MTKGILLKVIGFGLVLLFTGCANIQPTYKAEQKIDRNKLKANYNLIAQRASVDVSNKFLVYIPLTLAPMEIDDVVNKLSNELLNKYNGDVLTDVKVETNWLFTLYYNTYTYTLTANVWQRKEI
jgi:hypothetical protein